MVTPLMLNNGVKVGLGGDRNLIFLSISVTMFSNPLSFISDAIPQDHVETHPARSFVGGIFS
jgi:hypothetical protein